MKASTVLRAAPNVAWRRKRTTVASVLCAEAGTQADPSSKASIRYRPVAALENCTTHCASSTSAPTSLLQSGWRGSGLTPSHSWPS